MPEAATVLRRFQSAASAASRRPRRASSMASIWDVKPSRMAGGRGPGVDVPMIRARWSRRRDWRLAGSACCRAAAIGDAISVDVMLLASRRMRRTWGASVGPPLDDQAIGRPRGRVEWPSVDSGEGGWMPEGTEPRNELDCRPSGPIEPMILSCAIAPH